MDIYRICRIQVKSVPCDINANLETGARWIAGCRQQYDARLAVFPEAFTTGYYTGLSAADLNSLVDDIPGKTTRRIQKAARDHSMNIIWPTYERGPSGKVYNSAVFIDTQGEISAVYRKIHIFPTENAWSLPGDRICLVDTDIGRIGMMICYDGDFAELARIMALRGADIVVRPSAFIRSFDTWELTNCARAYDSNSYLLAVNCVGRDKGSTVYYGHSMIVSPQGRRIAQASAGEQIIYADVDMDIKKYAGYGCDTPLISDNVKSRRPELYGELV